MKTVEIDYFGKKLILETGRMAKQASASVVVHYGETTTLTAAVGDKKNNRDALFFPLTCSYQVKTYSQGRILGGFIKRENRPSEQETLISRMIDRPIRPLFPSSYKSETQVISTVLSYDDSGSPPAAALLGSSAALLLSDMPFVTPIAGVTVGLINDEFMVNPTTEQLENSKLNLFVVSTQEAIVMVESEAKEIDEETMLAALEFGMQAAQPLIEAQLKLRELAGKPKRIIEEYEVSPELIKKITKFAQSKIEKALLIPEKIERYAAIDAIKEETVSKFIEENPEESPLDIKETLGDIKKSIMRSNILKSKKRVDGRDRKTVRPITCELGILSRTHGSTLFTRGETQALVTATLASKEGEQMVEDSRGTYFKSFYLHYNFPSFSVGETGRMAPPGRREIGHGRLAERGLVSLLPDPKTFPYTIRLVSEILESNGSSSMASVCGGSLAMMDAGVPLKKHVAGIAMGMISQDSKHAILSDILGDEDHIGDMDFKVVGTKDGITALQMDIKIDGLSSQVMMEALLQAKEGRLHILQEMEKAISEPNTKLSQYAPRFIQHKIPVSKIKNIIGPGGSVIKSITAETGARLDIADDGIINISSSDQKSAESALAIIQELLKEVELGKIYEGTIKKIADFGLFVECIPGSEGLVHISELTEKRSDKLDQIYAEGQVIAVKTVSFDHRGKLKLTVKI